MITETVLAVKPGGVFQRARQRGCGSGEYGNGRVAKFHGEQSVPRPLLHRNIAADYGDGEHAYFGGTQRHEERDCVVRRGVGVDQDFSREVRIHEAVPSLHKRPPLHAAAVSAIRDGIITSGELSS